MESQAAAAHVVVVPNSSAGHAIPFLEFSQHLAAAGVVITIVTSDRHAVELEKIIGCADLTTQGLALRVLGLRDQKANLSHDDWKREVREVRQEELNVIRLLQEVVTDVGSPDSLHLRGVQPAGPPLCILHDMFVTWAQEAAENLRIEKHLLYVSPASVLSIDLESDRLFQESRVPITRETRDLIISNIPGLPPIRALDLPYPMVIAAAYSWMRLHHLRFRKADVILVNTFYDLEKPVLDALRTQVIGASDLQARSILEIGPLLPESYVNEDVDQQVDSEKDPCITWLNTRPPSSVLYISFGSFATHSAQQLLELAQGLEASGCSFLWLVRPPDAPGISAVNGNPLPITEFLPSGFEERVKDRGMCYSGWVQQKRILKHPAVGGFLSHCGWNSILETVCAGVPVLAWPKTAEQHINRRLLVDSLKAAIELEFRPYTKEELDSDVARPVQFVEQLEIEKKARMLMNEAEGQLVRENVKRLRAKAREVGAPGGSSRQNFDAYVRFLLSSRSNASASHCCQ